MEKPPDDLSGMNAAEVKEYIFGFISTLKLTEKKLQDLDTELLRWNSRLELARTRQAADLISETEKEIQRIQDQQQILNAECSELKTHIESMRKQIPLLAARERSIDPDLLEQELLMAAGYFPGEEAKARTERTFRDMEKESSAEDALAELKAKMGSNL
jgi:phage shock protein A